MTIKPTARLVLVFDDNSNFVTGYDKVRCNADKICLSEEDFKKKYGFSADERLESVV